MQSIQIDGTFTYCDNIKKLKIGDIIKLIPNPNNRINSEAIGAYTLNNEKIGYVPFKSNQIDIRAKYTVTKIKLSQGNPILLISRSFDNSNFICVEPDFIKELKYNKRIINTEFEDDLRSFKKYLSRSGNNLTNVGITFIDPNYINLLIEDHNNNLTLYYTVTKKYYEENIFKYDEFYNFNLTPKNIYQPFLIHRLECYIERNYRSISDLLKTKKLKFDNLVKNNCFKYFDKIMQSDFGFDKIESSNLIAIELNSISGRYNALDNKEVNNFIKTLIWDKIDTKTRSNEYLRLLKYDSEHNVSISMESFKNLYANLKTDNLCYNHQYESYCYIDLHDDVNIIEVTNDLSLDKTRVMTLILKLIISNKQVINIYNPMLGIILRLEIPETIKNNIIEILLKIK